MRLVLRHSKEITYLVAASDRSPSLYDKSSFTPDFPIKVWI